MDSVMYHVKRALRIAAGFALLLAGLAMVLLPGPGWVTVALGLALLAPDFPWAHDALHRLKHTAERLVAIARSWLDGLRNRFAPRS
jgi:uncharacterized protein (TIGR02611 family)